MLDPEILRLAEARIAADRREYIDPLRAEVGKAVAELASRGVLRSSIAIDRISGLGVAEIRRRAALGWQALQEALRAADVHFDETLPKDLRQVVERYLPERPEDLLSLMLAHGALGGSPEMTTGLEMNVRRATLLAREKSGAEIDFFVMSLKHGPKRIVPAPEQLGRDALTGLYTKSVFNQRGPVLIEVAKKEVSPIALLMMDIDRFKSVNDTFGHQAGDEAIKAVAGLLSKAVEGKGEGYLWGGDELAAILPNFTPDEAIALAERIRRAVEVAKLTQQGLTLTVSIGVATFPDHGQDHVALHDAADKALYDAKNHGRNLVRLSGEPPPAAPGPREPNRREPDPRDLTEESKTKIREAYFKTRIAHCPKDGAILKVVEAKRTSGRRSVYLFASCPMCGMDIKLPGPN